MLCLQACSGLPESGVCDERTWLALLGPEATPEDLEEVSQLLVMYPGSLCELLCHAMLLLLLLLH
jgi:hypothetical protein